MSEQTLDVVVIEQPLQVVDDTSPHDRFCLALGEYIFLAATGRHAEAQDVLAVLPYLMPQGADYTAAFNAALKTTQKGGD